MHLTEKNKRVIGFDNSGKQKKEIKNKGENIIYVNNTIY